MGARAEFNSKLEEVMEGKAANARLMKAEELQKVQDSLMKISQDGAKSQKDRNLMRRYGVMQVGGVSKVIKKVGSTAGDDREEVKQVAAFEEVYDVIKQAHQRLGHGGQKKTREEINKKWANITQEMIQIYISHCEECIEKSSKKVPKGLVVKPVRSHTIYSRGQVDLINYQTLKDGDYNYILTYMNHFSKFCILRPLTSKRASEVIRFLV